MQLTLVISSDQWKELCAGLGERPMKSALPVLQACEAQLVEQIEAQRVLSAAAQAKTP